MYASEGLTAQSGAFVVTVHDAFAGIVGGTSATNRVGVIG